jgi:hypothetical protein
MIYGVASLRLAKNSLSITKKNTQIVRHYAGTNISDAFDLGRDTTEIACTIIALDETEKITALALLHAQTQRELHFTDYYYKKVIPSSGINVKLEDGTYYISVTFIALDPIPYDETSGEALY